jgi:dTDP-4-amino-4,6-dideoxygalactose transaminase
MEALQRVVSSGQFVLGAEVEQFEAAMAGLLRIEHAIGVASGTDALLLALRALSIGEGDCVLTTPFTFASTAQVILRLGATPVFADVSPDTFNLSPERVREALASVDQRGKLKAIIPVHLYGRSCDMRGLSEVADSHDVRLVEDAAQVIGGFCETPDDGFRPAGTIGIAGCFSFYPTKNLGGMGDGGMVVTSDGSIAETIRTLRVHGSRERYEHTQLGINSRLDAIQAAVLRVKLRFLETWTRARIENARTYDRLFREAGLLDHGIALPSVDGGDGDMERPTHVYHLYVVRVREGRDALRRFLSDRNVGTEIYYPTPLHLQPCFMHLGYKPGAFPEAESAAKEVLALPIHPELSRDDQHYVVETIRDFYK